MNYEVYGPFIPVILLITFIGLFIWVLNPKNKAKYDEAANLPLIDADEQVTKNETQNGGEQR